MGILIAALIFAILLAAAIDLFLGHRSLCSLAATSTEGIESWPSLSVVVAARNEARHIRDALRSLLRQDYPTMEIIVVDDRSTDETGAIADGLAEQDSRLCVIHVRDLPADWLGKNHALYTGATEATGELLLFTDGDVIYRPDTLRRAVAHLTKMRLDHLAMGPTQVRLGPLITMAVGMFVLLLGLALKPWRARNPKSRSFIGIGAFNLIRRRCYESVGGHRAIAMRPDDDIKLGKLIKRAGWKQDIVLSDGAISIEWYASVREMIHGLTKNLFAGADYSVVRIAGATVFLTAVFIWPFAAVFLTGGVARIFYFFSCVVVVVMYLDTARVQRLPVWSVVGIPFATLLLLFIFWKSTLTTLIGRGITWRGTHYPLDKLRRNRV